MTHTELQEWLSNQELFRLVVESAPLGIAVVDRDGQTLYSNRALRGLFGYDDREMLTVQCAGLTHSDDVDESQRLLAELVAGERNSYRILKRYRRKDGSIVWGDTSVVAIRDAAGGFRFGVPIVADFPHRGALGPEVDGDPVGNANLAVADRYETLTPREREVFPLAAAGLTSTAIAKRLRIGRRTVEVHRANIRRKLGLQTVTELVHYALQRGLLRCSGSPGSHGQ